MMHFMIYFCIDLDVKVPEIMEFSGKALQEDLEFYNVSNALELSDFDRKIFTSEADAELFLKQYREAYTLLVQSYKVKNSKLPCLLYKRRYLVQSLMGAKPYTVRKYKKQWEPGQEFYLHDQVHFLPVRLTSITPVSNGEWRYDFDLQVT